MLLEEMAGIKTAILLFVIALLDSILTVKVREREVKEKEKDEVKESNEYDMKSIFYYLNQNSKEKKDKITGYENDEQSQRVKVKEIENEEPRHIKVKERENDELRHIKVKERENNEQRFIKVKDKESRDHHNIERETNHRKNKEKEVTVISENRNMSQNRRAKEENYISEGITPKPKKAHRGFSKIVPTVGAYVTPKITSIKKWNYKNKGTKEEDEDVSQSFADDYRFERTIKEKKRRNKDKRQKIGGRRNKESRNNDKIGYSHMNNDLVISKEINMTKSFKSDQPVDIIVHIKMKN